jgi:hypothetical protein
MRCVLGLSLVTLLTAFSRVFAQDHNASRPGDIDLADLGPSTEFSIQLKGDVRIQLLNLVIKEPRPEYSLEAEIIEADEPPFDVGLFKVPAPPEGEKSRDEPPAVDPVCTGAYGEVARAADEKSVKSALSKLSKLTQCADTYARAIDQTQSSHSVASEMGTGDSLKVTVTRGPADAAKTWVVLFRGRRPGAWVATYAFAFLHNLDKDYFARQTGADAYQITKENNRERITFAPAIFFSWHRSRGRWHFTDGITGGLGFDLSDPVVFLGYQGTIHRNLTVTGGVAAAKVNRLKGRYKEGDPLTENLDEEQLHDRPYRATGFLAVGFRFGGSPF